MEAEDTLNSRLVGMFDELIDDLINTLDFEYLAEYGTFLARQDIDQVMMDYLEEYKVIVGEEVIRIFETASEQVEKQLIIQEDGLLIDFIANNDNLNYVNKNLKNTSSEVDKDSSSGVHQSSKKIDFSSTFNTLLEKFSNFLSIPKPPSSAVTYIENVMQNITPAVHESVNVPELLFNIIPNEQVLKFLDERVFVASESTLQKVGRNIYKIIGKTAENEGLHPYDVAKILRKEFEDLTRVESRRIARTEILRSKNEAKWQRVLNNETVEYIQWIATVDEFSRDDHAEQADMITYTGNAFPNGQRYPYDETGDPGDYINCRCDYEAYYPDVGLMPPEGADYWFEEDMVPSGFAMDMWFDVIMN